MPKLKPLRVGLPNIKRYKGAIAVAGIVRLGAFRKGDVVEIHHGNETMSATILTARESRLHLSLWLYPAYASASGKYPKESNIDGGDLESDRAGILEGMHAIARKPQASPPVTPSRSAPSASETFPARWDEARRGSGGSSHCLTEISRDPVRRVTRKRDKSPDPCLRRGRVGSLPRRPNPRPNPRRASSPPVSRAGYAPAS